MLVLFFGGLAANWQQMRQVLVPSLRLATLGSLLTAAALAVVVWGFQTLPILPDDREAPEDWDALDGAGELAPGCWRP